WANRAAMASTKRPPKKPASRKNRRPANPAKCGMPRPAWGSTWDTPATDGKKGRTGRAAKAASFVSCRGELPRHKIFTEVHVKSLLQFSIFGACEHGNHSDGKGRERG